ncbi:ABC transporter permease [Brevundimonas variabilis]|uniref:Iron(III) transport system permease protein n=1 Tax=Brevundimonas variabilis TaxID=74312 RepID=A0A7W9CL47_9CAUL|nr:iron ABC transporter permease [Brevundimonas variabilis]MBB5747695.1 iron(III) transport system permease protein [Brevundimonas variabilis]
MRLLAFLAAAVAIAPLIGVVAAAFGDGRADIAAADLVRYALTSMALAFLVGLSTAVLGSVSAWLVVMHSFPGRNIFAWALALPLAAPAFAVAYAYADLFDVAGELRTWMRAVPGLDWGPQMRSLPGAAFVLSLAFYPYVYLTVRAALVNQSSQAIEAARSLGCSPTQALVRVALPLLRPALAAGVALAVMETLADYGAVQFLSVQTLTTGVVRSWFVYGSLEAAARLALPLLGAAALLLWIERLSRKGRTDEAARARWRPIQPTPLEGGRGLLALAFCIGLLTLGLFLPAGWLAIKALDISPDWPRLVRAASHSLGLGLGGAIATVILATCLALSAERMPFTARISSLGYATPGAVMAIGLLAPASLLWQNVPGAVSGLGVGLLLLIYAYAARLMAAALEPVEAGLTRVTPSMVSAARTLGRSETGAALAVRLPIASGAMLTAVLVVFIDVVKELPATLILRPFNVDTLAVIADNYARDERLPNAGWPSLMILALTLPAVIWLTRKITASRPGDLNGRH